MSLHLIENIEQAWPPAGWIDVHVAVALSGGADSVALLRGLVELRERHQGRGEVFAIHVNHHLRGDESDDDAAWCAELCRDLGVTLDVCHAEAASRRLDEGDGLESAARNERYRLLTELAEARGARYLATAHTYDDQIETVLFRLLRGTGLRGLAGIAPQRALTRSLTVIRPLLNCRRQEILAYLEELGQSYRTDNSNASREFMRNRIRNELLPLLRSEFSSNVDESIERLADQAGGVQSFIEGQAAQLLEISCEWNTAIGFALNTITLNTHPQLLIIETIRLAWRRAELPEQAMTHRWWRQLAELTAKGASTGVLNLPGNVRVERAGDVLVVNRVN